MYTYRTEYGSAAERWRLHETRESTVPTSGRTALSGELLAIRTSSPSGAFYISELAGECRETLQQLSASIGAELLPQRGSLFAARTATDHCGEDSAEVIICDSWPWPKAQK